MSNPDIDVALITNQDLPEAYGVLFDAAAIKVVIVPFDNFRMPDSFQWQYAFYKLAVLEHIVSNSDYDYILGLDTDTYVKGSLENLWTECDYDLPILYGLDVLDGKKQIEKDYLKLMTTFRYIQQIGGEFIAGNKKSLQLLNKHNTDIYRIIKDSDYDIDNKSGDEAILSMAASEIKYISARPFMRRYWTRKAFYEVDFSAERVPVWHLPAEKNFGLFKAYTLLKDASKLPLEKKMMALFNLPRQNPYNLSMMKYYLYRVTHRK